MAQLIESGFNYPKKVVIPAGEHKALCLLTHKEFDLFYGSMPKVSHKRRGRPVYFEGHKYDSRHEAKVMAYLSKYFMPNEEVVLHPTYPLIDPYTHQVIGEYTADIKIGQWVIDVKPRKDCPTIEALKWKVRLLPKSIPYVYMVTSHGRISKQ